MSSIYHNSRNFSREFLSPDMYSSSRQATLMNAMISLITTILGGGVLSLPFAFSKTGLLVGYIMLAVIATASDFSIYLLIYCSRRTPYMNSTYEDIASYTLGKRSKVIVCVLLFVLTYLCCIAYLLLIRDLVTSLIEYMFNIHATYYTHIYVMTGITLLLTPLCLQHTLTSLTSASTLSLISLLILGITIAYRVLYEINSNDQSCLVIPTVTNVQSYDYTTILNQHNNTTILDTTTTTYDTDIKLFPSTLSDVIYAFPIMSVTYLCHFNVLPLHSELINPTHIRVKQLIHGVILLCSGMYIFIGTIGYIHSGNSTNGNILNNFNSNDSIITLGRLGLTFTCCCTYPLLVLPCKKVLHRLILMCYNQYKQQQQQQQRSDSIDTEEYKDDIISDKTTLLQHNNTNSTDYNGNNMKIKIKQYNTMNNNNIIDNSDLNSEISSIISYIDSDDDSDSNEQLNNQSVLSTSNICETCFILITVLLISCNVSSVATLWSIIGSSVSLLITFILPSLMYIIIRRYKPFNTSTLLAYILLITSTIAMITCTYQAIVAVIK